MFSRHKQSHGFTLVEAALVISLLAILSFGIGNFIITALQSYVLVSGRDALANSARTSLNRMSYEFRKIYRPQGILTAATSECRFRDIDNETIDFKQSGTDLLRNDVVMATALASPEGLRFSYLNENGGTAGVSTEVRSIRIWLSFNSRGQVLTVETSARLRNL